VRIVRWQCCPPRRGEYSSESRATQFGGKCVTVSDNGTPHHVAVHL